MMGCCCGEEEAVENERKKEKLVGERWKLGRILGRGGFGKVYEVYDMLDNQKMYAMKMEELKKPEDRGRLPQEARVLEILAANNITEHVVQLIDKGRIPQQGKPPIQFIIMTLLGPSLATLRRLFPTKSFSPPTVGNIGAQAMTSVESLHRLGFIHRDIKPGNFMVGEQEQKRVVYLIDFGMTRNIFNEDGTLKPRRNKAIPFRGTVRYSSISTHKGEEYGRHDDLWCLFNALIELRKGNLPWSTEKNRKVTFDLKYKVVPQRWLNDIDPEFLLLYENLTTLHYDMTPDYDRCRRILERILLRYNCTMESPLDWEPGNEHYFEVSKILAQLFREEPESRRCDDESKSDPKFD